MDTSFSSKGIRERAEELDVRTDQPLEAVLEDIEDHKRILGYHKAEEKSVLPTGGRAATAKETLSSKDKAIKLIRDAFGFSEDRVYPIKQTRLIGAMRWRPFDQYCLNAGWSRHASRMSVLRDQEITTPYGKKVSFVDSLKFMKELIEAVEDRDLRDWEQREFDAIEKQPVRGLFRPLMYLGRLQLEDGSFYPKPLLPEAWQEFSFPSFQPLSGLDQIEIRADARTANVGFPWLERLSIPGVDYHLSPVYIKVIAAASEWKERVEHLPKITLETIAAESPPLAVFDRSQSQARPIKAVSKKLAFNEMTIVQPAYLAAETSVPGYAFGDRARRLVQARDILSGKITELADGDDLVVRLNDGSLLGVDASAFDASISYLENQVWMEKMGVGLTDSQWKLWSACCFGSHTEGVCSIGMVQNVEDPFRAIISGKPDTHLEGTICELMRSRSSPHTSEAAFIEGMNRFGIYEHEYHPGQYVIIGKLFSKGDTIHGSVVRCINALRQRESPVLESHFSKEAFALMEDARVLQVCSNSYNHEMFDRLCRWASSHWQIRHDRTAVARAATDLAVHDKDRNAPQGEVSGEIEREAISATLEYFQ